MHSHRWTGAALATAFLAVTAPAHAQPTADHAAAQALVTQLEGDPHAQLAADALGQARTALKRALDLGGAGDAARAKAADDLALEWATMARDLLKAVDAETTATDMRKKAVDAQAQLERTRVAVEEGIARVGRLQAELAEAEARAHDNRAAVEVHDGDKPPKKAADKPRKKGGAPQPKKTALPGDAP